MRSQPLLSLYWKCQLCGWSLAALYWAYTAYTGGGFNWWQGLWQFISDVALYILLTHMYRGLALRWGWQNLALKPMVRRIIPAILVMGLAYTITTLIKIRLFRAGMPAMVNEDLATFIRNNWLAVFMAGLRLMSIWLLAYHLYHYAQREIRSSGENARLQLISREAQLNNLSAQLNPHFLFNSLNNIKALVAENPTAARRAIDLLSELLRSGLSRREQALCTVATELDLVRDYLELEQLRLEERLHQEFIIDPAAEHALIPCLSIQSLAENAVKHGISRQKNGGLIRISVTQEHGYTRIIVQNTGSLQESNPGTGLGIRNLNERLALLYKGAASLNLQQESPEQVSATLIIPVLSHT